jgi:hypothetical protein
LGGVLGRFRQAFVSRKQQAAHPVEFPSGRVTPSWVGTVAKSDTGDVVIRSHLVPRNASDERCMGAFRTFWRALAFADRKNVEGCCSGG